MPSGLISTSSASSRRIRISATRGSNGTVDSPWNDDDQSIASPFPLESDGEVAAMAAPKSTGGASRSTEGAVAGAVVVAAAAAGGSAAGLEAGGEGFVMGGRRGLIVVAMDADCWTWKRRGVD